MKVKHFYKNWRCSALSQWIISGCIVLMIPILCAVINFFINKNLIERKINQVNDFMLKNIQYNIDFKLNGLQEISRYIQLDERFNSYALNRGGEKEFLTQVQKCYSVLKTFVAANPDIDIMLFIPGKEYALTSSTANRMEFIYNTLYSQKKTTLSYEEWRAIGTAGYQNEFLISDELSYENCGRENLVYASKSFYTSDSDPCTIFVSIPTSFIESLFNNDNIENTILILDRDNRILGSYGKPVNLRTLDEKWNETEKNFTLDIGGQDYVGAFTSSRISKWNYVILTPKAVYMHDVIRNRNLNLLIVMAGLFMGIASVILLQRRNYRPVKKMMEALTIKDRTARVNEFALVENNLLRLYRENKSMKDSIKDRKEYDREMFLLSGIKGRKSFFKDTEIGDILGRDLKDRQFALVTMNLDTEDEKSASAAADDFELLAFSINNVIDELFGDTYLYLKTIDDMFIVYLFVLEKESGTAQWQEIFRNRFNWICDFFPKYFKMELAVTMGSPFEPFSYIDEEYDKIQVANEYRYFVEPYGVIAVESLQEMDFTSAERLKYYNRRFEEVLAETDFERGMRLTEELFGELLQTVKTFQLIHYYILSVVNDLLLALQSMMPDEEIPEESLKQILQDLRTEYSLNGLQARFICFLKQICRGVDSDGRNSCKMAEIIKNYVQENYKDCNMNITAIAQGMGITPRYLSRIFRDQTGVGLLNFINHVRIEQATVLLKNSAMTVDEIAEKTGFTNTRTFRRNFLKITGKNAVSYKRR